MENTKRIYDSRRATQRRFPPGSFWIDGGLSLEVKTIIGWSPVPPELSGWRDKMTIASWEALVLSSDMRLEHISWTRIKCGWSPEEWEEG